MICIENKNDKSRNAIKNKAEAAIIKKVIKFIAPAIISIMMMTVIAAIPIVVLPATIGVIGQEMAEWKDGVVENVNNFANSMSITGQGIANNITMMFTHGFTAMTERQELIQKMKDVNIAVMEDESMQAYSDTMNSSAGYIILACQEGYATALVNAKAMADSIKGVGNKVLYNDKDVVWEGETSDVLELQTVGDDLTIDYWDGSTKYSNEGDAKRATSDVHVKRTKIIRETGAFEFYLGDEPINMSDGDISYLEPAFQFIAYQSAKDIDDSLNGVVSEENNKDSYTTKQLFDAVKEIILKGDFEAEDGSEYGADWSTQETNKAFISKAYVSGIQIVPKYNDEKVEASIPYTYQETGYKPDDLDNDGKPDVDENGVLIQYPYTYPATGYIKKQVYSKTVCWLEVHLTRNYKAELNPAVFEEIEKYYGFDEEYANNVKPALEMMRRMYQIYYDEMMEVPESIYGINFNAPLKVTPTLTANFGYVNDSMHNDSKRHSGNDFACPAGTPIYAAADGVVIHAAPQITNGVMDGYGNYVEVQHVTEDGTMCYTLYAHMLTIRVNVGDRVTKNDVVGLVGSTGRSSGPHLHLGLYIGDDFVDSKRFIPQPYN